MKNLRRIRTEGAYIIKAAESRPPSVLPKGGRRGPAVVTDEDRRLAAALIAALSEAER